MSADRGTRVSYPLTEIRTVHSRAVTALDTVQRIGADRDPEQAEIALDLAVVVARLDKWKRTGRAK